MLKLRILSVVVALPLLLAALFFLPHQWWVIALIAPLLVAGHEWSRLGGFGCGAEIAFLAILLAGYTLLTGIANFPALRPVPAMESVERAVYAVSAGFWCVVAPCWLWLGVRVHRHLVLVVAGIVVLLPAWLALAQLQRDATLLLLLLAVIWIADTAAYFSGRALGRRKLAPAISPGKTWEGAGGAFAAVAVYAVCVHSLHILTLELHIIIASFFGMTTFSIAGDLLESWLKRNAGVKDSGNLMPGHGGLLDRLDGVTAALPLAALIFI